MKHYVKNGVNFISDLIWQTKIPGERFVLKNYLKDCKFDFYCRSKQFSNVYGFGRYPKESSQREIFLKLKKPKSLALHVVDSLAEVDTTDSCIICFCFDNKATDPVYGYVFVYQGAISPENGEFLGSLDELKERMEFLTSRYSIDLVFVPDDIPFFNNSAFEYKLGVKFGTLFSESDDIPASEYLFFSGKSSYGAIRKLDRTKEKKIGAIIAGVFVILFAIYQITDYFTEDEDLDSIPVVTQPVVIQSYPANVFINNCLKNFDKYVIDNGHWRTKEFKCSVDGIKISYSAGYEGDNVDIRALLGNSVVMKSDTEAELIEKISFPHYTAIPSSLSIEKKSEMLKKSSHLLDMHTNINGSHFEISSGYSPLFLYQNNIINNLYLSELTMTLDYDSGFMNWKIVGELDAK